MVDMKIQMATTCVTSNLTCMNNYASLKIGDGNLELELW